MKSILHSILPLSVWGKNPSGSLCEKLRQSPQYQSGRFTNVSPTPMMTQGNSPLKTILKFLGKPADTRPAGVLPSVITDLKNRTGPHPEIVWFGHSSYLITIEGKRILVDPVFSGHASPFSFMVKAFPGSDLYGADQMPEIDCLLLTHDHYDHLDFNTLKKLQPKIKSVVCSLGVSSHLLQWGFTAALITELDWWQSLNFTETVVMTAAPARHFSGRGLSRGRTLWSSFILQTAAYSIYIGGDSGYDRHFKEIGGKFGPFDLAILESGQYNPAWPFIHMAPEETLQAASDLNAHVLLPVHWGKFSLALHPWKEPIDRIRKSASLYDFLVTTPMIGEPVVLDKYYPVKEWWNFESAP